MNKPLSSATETSATPKKPADTAKSATKPPTKRGRGCLIFVLLLALLGGSGYYAYQETPLRAPMQKIAERLVAQLLHSATAPAPPSEVLLPVTNSAPAAVAVNAAAIPAVSPAPTPPALDNPRQQAEIDQLRQAVADLRISQSVLAVQLKKLGDTAATPDDNFYLSIIDLRLRQNGDAAAAVKALLLLRGNAAVDQQWLADEINRLQNIPNREQIARIIQNLLAADNRPAAATGAGGGVLASLFNIRKVTATTTDSRPLLLRLEMLLLTDQRRAYMRLLNDFSERFSSAADTQINMLVKFGAPRYALTYGTLP